MMSDSEIISMVFGFKVKYLRQQKALTYKQLAEKADMSVSYVHEVEKGKKYPKPNKIKALANALGTSYDELVSSRADKKLQPVIDLLTSDFIKIFPLDLFGISPWKLFDLFSNAPDRVNAFVGTIFNIARQYQLRSDRFYKSALRSYQDMRDNFFPDLETAAQSFKSAHSLQEQVSFTPDHLAQLLKEHFQIQVDFTVMKALGSLTSVRSYFDADQKVLFIQEGLQPAQCNFLLARELGFQYLQLEPRPLLTRIREVNSFELLLNNFKASYFSAALLMDKNLLAADITRIAQLADWDGTALMGLLDKYIVTPEMLMQRLTNVLPGHFGINDLFFLRLEGRNNLRRYEITKELHLSRLHNPYANENSEHYCRRWVSLNVIKQLGTALSLGQKAEPLIDVQISDYWQTDNAYLCISFAKSEWRAGVDGSSVTLGLLINDQLRRLFRFLSDPKLPRQIVHTTCERCSIVDCANRAAAPKLEEQKIQELQLQQALSQLKASNK